MAKVVVMAEDEGERIFKYDSDDVDGEMDG